uniref:Pentatricopeptide repeat-containing protein n=1 Tax=Arundo donax TaxID=35708 RepID=A0A0A9HLK4_ARUDO
MKRKLLASTGGLYDMLISSYCEKGNTKRALWLYDKMMNDNEKFVPSVDTFMMLVRRVIKIKSARSPNL